MALDLGDSYYNPIHDSQQEKVGIKQALFTTAKTMVTMAALNMAGAAAFRALSGKATSAIRKYSLGKWGSLARETGARTLGDIAKNTGSGKALNSSFRSATKSFRQSLNTRSKLISSMRSKGPLHAAKTSFTSVFASPKTFAAVAAKTAYR
jgi:hypothetical protein